MKSIGAKILLSSIVIVLFSILLISVPVITIQYKNLVNSAIDSAESKVIQANANLNRFLQKPISIISTTQHYLITHPDNQK